MISTLITDRPMCLPCIGAKTSLRAEAVETAVSVLERALAVHRYDGRVCQGCGTITTVVVLERD